MIEVKPIPADTDPEAVPSCTIHLTRQPPEIVDAVFSVTLGRHQAHLCNEHMRDACNAMVFVYASKTGQTIERALGLRNRARRAK